MTVTNDNCHGEEIVRRARRRLAVLDAIAEAQEEIKQYRAEDKADGFNEKALGQVIKEMRCGADYQVDQLTLKLELDTYRKACDLPVTLEEAQKRAAGKAAEVPEPKRQNRRANEPLN